MCEERSHEVVALGSELQHVSSRHNLGDLGHPIDRVCRSLLSVCLGRRKDLALKTIAGPFRVVRRRCVRITLIIYRQISLT